MPPSTPAADAERKPLGFTKHSRDAEGREVRERLEAVAECPGCGKDVELWSDTEEWVKKPSGAWCHSQYGPAQGCCCGYLIVDSFDGCQVYDLRSNRKETSHAH